MAEYSGRDKRLAYLFDAVENVQVDDMTGASASADGTHGLVPAPLAGDENKYLKGDGTWAAVQAGAGALSGLSDVDLVTPTDGQALVYDGANSKWKNGNVGGGQATVGLAWRLLDEATYMALSTAEKNNGTIYFVSETTGADAEGKTYIYISASDYANLSTAEKNNGIPYFVYD